jgi:hypothetical protein
MQIGGSSKNSRSGIMEMIPNICITHAYVMPREENCITSSDHCKSGSQLCLLVCGFVLLEGFSFPFLTPFLSLFLVLFIDFMPFLYQPSWPKW